MTGREKLSERTEEKAAPLSVKKSGCHSSTLSSVADPGVRQDLLASSIKGELPFRRGKTNSKRLGVL